MIEKFGDNLLRQGDIIENISILESIQELGDTDFSFHLIQFPYAIILSQACDLEQDKANRDKLLSSPEGTPSWDHDKCLFAVLVAPLYNAEQFKAGEHLKDLDKPMNMIDSKRFKIIMQNNNDRYHYFDFGNELDIVPSIVDFKHFFTCNINYLLEIHKTSYKATLSVPFRERFSQRFANYLSRIGLPDNSVV